MSVQNNALKKSDFNAVYPCKDSSWKIRTGTKFYSNRTSDLLSQIPEGTEKTFLLRLLATIPSDSFIAGGAGLALFTGDLSLVNDYDVYCSNEQSSFDLYQKLLNHGFVLEKQTAFAVNMRLGDFPPVSIIRVTYFDNMEHCLDSFDFTVCQFGFGPEIACCNPLGIISHYNKKLVVHNLYPENDCLYRLVKYTKKGYDATQETLDKIHQFIVSNQPLNTGVPAPTLAEAARIEAENLSRLLASAGPLRPEAPQAPQMVGLNATLAQAGATGHLADAGRYAMNTAGSLASAARNDQGSYRRSRRRPTPPQQPPPEEVQAIRSTATNAINAASEEFPF